MYSVTGERLHEATGYVRARARREPVEVTHHGRPEFVMVPVEEYALLRDNRRLAFRREEMPQSKLERIASNQVSPEHASLDALMDD